MGTILDTKSEHSKHWQEQGCNVSNNEDVRVIIKDGFSDLTKVQIGWDQ